MILVYVNLYPNLIRDKNSYLERDNKKKNKFIYKKLWLKINNPSLCN